VSRGGQSRAQKAAIERANERIDAAKGRLRRTLFGPLLQEVKFALCTTGDPALACVDPGQAMIWLNPLARGDLSVEQWVFAIGHQLLHLGLEHERRRHDRDPLLWNVACEIAADGLLWHLRIGRPLPEQVIDPQLASKKEEELYDMLTASPRELDLPLVTCAGPQRTDIVTGGQKGRFGVSPRGLRYEELLAEGIRRGVESAVQEASDALTGGRASPDVWAPGEEARRWVMNELPLLGPLAAQMRIVADPHVAKALDVSIAAIDPCLGEVYFNPGWLFSAAEIRFVYVHELLHAALLHHTRGKGRDPWLWNVACDFVVNAWLIEAGIGSMPSVGGCFDPRLAGKSAEEVYDLLGADPRACKGLRGFRGKLGDILFDRGGRRIYRGDVCTLDDLIKRCLATGLSCPDRGRLPLGLIEEIKSLFVPPVPWDVELGRWMERHVPLVREARRSFARASRRQSSTPDIPRPARHVPQEWLEACTFGVVLDTSGSMDRALLGRALGAIASYAEARDVPAVRLVLCDARPYDQGFVAPADLRGVFPVRGRGGTVLQPAVSWLLSRPDFPPSAPVMILTDGQCEERLIVPREHCFVLPRKSEDALGVTLRTTAPVFRVLKESHEPGDAAAP
jgi:predicted metal-dependent peptidase